MSRPKVGKYTELTPTYGDKMSVQEWLASVECGCFIDYDGYGHPVRGLKMDGSIIVRPSERLTKVPLDAKQIMWYNR